MRRLLSVRTQLLKEVWDTLAEPQKKSIWELVKDPLQLNMNPAKLSEKKRLIAPGK